MASLADRQASGLDGIAAWTMAGLSAGTRWSGDEDHAAVDPGIVTDRDPRGAVDPNAFFDRDAGA
jgi:hypothetical protein